jgi:hypothetical protein
VFIKTYLKPALKLHGYSSSGQNNMTKYLFVSIYLFSVLNLFGQKKNVQQYATEKQQEAFDRSHDCLKYVSKPFAQRLKNYPFSNAAQIQLVSFGRQVDTLNGAFVVSDKDSLPRKNDTICYSRLFEVKNLTYSQVDKLTDILYNYGYRSKPKDDGLIYIETIIQCYFPRNAILFLDANGKAFEFIEICFECEKTRKSSARISLGVMCNQKMDLLKDFFKGVGLEYGITTGLTTDK